MPRYDLAGNLIPDDPSPPPAPRHEGITVEHITQARLSDGLAERILENSSGALDDVPDVIEKKRWNWGAFLLPSFWAFNHGMKPLAFVIWGLGIALHFVAQVPSPLFNTLGIVYTVFCLGVSLWLGFCGNTIAWRIRRFEGGVDEFFDVQKAYVYAGVAVAILSIILGGKLTPGIALYKWQNVTRPVNGPKTDYEVFYGGKPPL